MLVFTLERFMSRIERRSATPPRSLPAGSFEEGAGEAGGRKIARNKPNMLGKQLHRAAKGAKNRARKIKRTLAGKRKPVAHMTRADASLRRNSRRLGISTESLTRSLSILGLDAAQPRRKKGNRMTKNMRAALKKIGLGGDEGVAGRVKKKRSRSAKKARLFQPYSENFANDLFARKEIAPLLTSHAQRSAGDLQKDLRGVFLQDVLAHEGETAARKMAQGASPLEAAPGARRAVPFEHALEGCAWHEKTETALTGIKQMTTALEAGTLDDAGKQTLSNELQQLRREATQMQTHLADAMVEHVATANADKSEVNVNFLILTQALSNKLAGQHMALAEIEADYGDYLPQPSTPAGQGPWPQSAEPVSYYKDGLAHNYVNHLATAGNAFAAQFAEPYEGGIPASALQQNGHVRNLALTGLSREEDGVPVVRALRHAALDPSGITPDYLRNLPAPELKTLLHADYWDDSKATERIPNADALAYHCATRAEDKELEAICQTLRDNGAEKMGRELATAALLSDEGKASRALEGEVVDVALAEISLLTPGLLNEGMRGERTMLKRQAGALKKLAAQPQPMTLQLHDKTGALKAVQVNFRLRQFNFGVDEGSHRFAAPVMRRLAGWGVSAELNNPALTELAGPAQESKLGGAVGVRVAALQRNLTRLYNTREDILANDPTQSQPDTRKELAKLDKETAIAQRRFNLFFQTGHQIKQLWRRGQFRTSGMKAYGLAARITVLCDMLGETPAISDSNGVSHTSLLDGEVKRLAAHMESHGLPPSLTDEETPEQIDMQAKLLAGKGEQALREANFAAINQE